MELLHKIPAGAVRSRSGGIYSVMAQTSMGEVKPELLAVINSLVQELGLPGVRVTARQRIQLIGIPEEHVGYVVEQLGKVGETCKYFVQACIGSRGCRFGIRDSIAMGEQLENFLNTLDLPAKLKSGVSGCSMSCAASYVRDVGLVATGKGWTVLFGGNAGKGVRKGDAIAVGMTGEQALQVLETVLEFYKKNAKNKERTSRFVNRIGREVLMQVAQKCNPVR